MQTSAVVAVVTDGAQYWTELFQGDGDNPQGTFARHVDAKRWPSMFDAKSNSPWWPSGEPGAAPAPDHERMHRALCSWSGCGHQVLWVARLPAKS